MGNAVAGAGPTGILGLIAGAGELPLEIARAARVQGRPVHAVGFHRLTQPALEPLVDEFEWLHLGELGALLAAFARSGVCDAVMAGKVARAHLYAPLDSLRPDALAARVLAALGDHRDETILCALADLLAEQGIALRPQAELVPELLGPLGVLGRCRPTPEQHADLVYGWPLARWLAAQDIGQSVVVRQRGVLALEAIEGTDETIARAARYGALGACVIKVARPDQDPRFDLPAIGPRTLQCVIAAGAGVLAFEAGRTVVLARDELIARADEAGVVLVGIASSGPTRAPEGAA